MPAPNDRPLIGRHDELFTIDRALRARRRHREPRVVCVSIEGEPGIGKSRLLTELASRARAGGRLVLEARGTEFEQDVPFGVFVAALEPATRSIASRDLARLGDEAHADLAALLPWLRTTERPRTGPPSERDRGHRGVRALLALLAGDRRLVLALDDVHWADAGSLELLSHLLRSPASEDLLVALAFRPGQAPQALAEALGGLASEAHARLVLGPLGDSDALQLLAPGLDDRRRAELLAQCGGNPLYLEQLSSAAAARSRPPELADVELPLPVRAAFATELAGLSADARQFLRAAAVAGDPFRAELAAAVAKCPAQRAGELIERDLVRVVDGSLLRFRHPILRRAAYASAPNGWLLAAHRRAAAALAEIDAPASEQAHHLERSARPGDERAADLLARAALAVAGSAPDTASRWLSAALRVLPRTDAHREQRLGLLLAQGQALMSSGQLAACDAVLAQALDLVPADRVAARLELLLRRARLESLRGRSEHAERLLRQILADSGHDAAEVWVELALVEWTARRYDGVRRCAEHARALASAQAARATEVEATAVLAAALAFEGDGSRSHRLIDEAARGLPDLTQDAQLTQRTACLVFLGIATHLTGRLDELELHAGDGLALARATGQRYAFVVFECQLTLLEIARGGLQRAAAHARDCEEGARMLGDEHQLGWALGLRSWVARLSGELPVALRLGADAVAAGGRTPEMWFSWLPIGALAGAQLEVNEPEAARDLLLEHAGGPRLGSVERSFRPYFYELLARCEIAVGQLDDAARWIDFGATIANDALVPARSAEIRRAAAALALARGEHGSAVHAAEASVRGFALAGASLDVARARILLGRALSAAGDPDRGADELELARRELHHCGAVRYRDEAARELRLLGRRAPGPATPPRDPGARIGIATLSPREREIAERVSRGWTNGQIAAELFLSDRTVETHLSRAYAKLGVRSRAQLAGAVERARRDRAG